MSASMQDEAVNSIFHRMSTRALRDAKIDINHVNEAKREVKDLVASEVRKGEERTARIYRKELDMYKKLHDVHMQTEQLKIPEYVFCSGCGKKLMEGNHIEVASLKDTHTGEE